MKRSPRTSSVAYLVAVGMFAKIFIDISAQLYNPFLLVYASGLGLSVITMGQMVSLRNLMGLTAPMLGHLADKVGYRFVMRLSLLFIGAGLLLLSTGWGFPIIILSMILIGFGKSGFTPNLHSYLSSKLPYSKRARYIGIVEYTWAFAGILGLSLVGVLLELFSWREPLFLLGGGVIIASFFVSTLPKAEKKAASNSVSQLSHKGLDVEAPKSRLKRLLIFFYLGTYWKSAWAAILLNFFNFFAIAHILIIHGAWLQLEYGLAPARLGLVALLMGATDWIGSLLVSLLGDRIGKRNSVIIGVSGMILFFMLLPFLNLNLPLALLSILLPRFCFEFTTVSNIPLLSEQYPQQRGKIMSLSATAGLLGGTVAASTGPALYLTFGVWGLGPVSAVAVCVSGILSVFFICDAPHSHADKDPS